MKINSFVNAQVMHSRRDNSPYSPWYEGYQLTKSECGQPEDFQYSTSGPKMLYFQTYSGRLLSYLELNKVYNMKCLWTRFIDSINSANSKDNEMPLFFLRVVQEILFNNPKNDFVSDKLEHPCKKSKDDDRYWEFTTKVPTTYGKGGPSSQDKYDNTGGHQIFTYRPPYVIYSTPHSLGDQVSSNSKPKITPKERTSSSTHTYNHLNGLFFLISISFTILTIVSSNES